MKTQNRPELKVGDWVEFIDAGGHKSQGKYLSKAYDNTILVLDITYNMRCVVPTTKIIRKLDPSEVRVRITLEGQVTKPVDNAGGRFWMYYSTDEYLSVELDALSNKDRELVESLLEAQEEK